MSLASSPSRDDKAFADWLGTYLPQFITSLRNLPAGTSSLTGAARVMNPPLATASLAATKNWLMEILPTVLPSILVDELARAMAPTQARAWPASWWPPSGIVAPPLSPAVQQAIAAALASTRDIAPIPPGADPQTTKNWFTSALQVALPIALAIL
jgi:hypothetical protein